MRKRANFFPIFLLVLSLSIVLLILPRSPFGFLEKGISLFQKSIYNAVRSLPFAKESTRVKELEKLNLELLSKLSDQKRLERENAALLDQFRTANPISYNLLPSNIVGASSTTITIDKGSKDSVKVGQAVVLDNNLFGVVSKTTLYLSKVVLVTDPSFLLTGKTERGVSGVVKGLGNGTSLENVLLSDNLTVKDIVFTRGDMDILGVGVPKDLVIGKIASIEKNPSALFQKAKIESLVNASSFPTVFVVMEPK